jgi:hypothetical protein
MAAEITANTILDEHPGAEIAKIHILPIEKLKWSFTRPGSPFLYNFAGIASASADDAKFLRHEIP